MYTGSVISLILLKYSLNILAFSHQGYIMSVRSLCVQNWSIVLSVAQHN